MNRWAALALLLAVAGALALRLPHLAARPLHNDEGVNAVKIAALWERGDYKYDPHEFHGPTLYYAALPYLWLGKAHNADELDATRLRLVTIAFGVGLIFLLCLLADGLGNCATALAAGLIAVSPAMVFYSRYFIHEMLLVFFTLLAIAAGWRYWKSKRPGWAALGGAAVGLMFATKETFVLSIAAMVGAAIATAQWNCWWTDQALHDGLAATPLPPTSQPRAKVHWRRFFNRNHIILAALAAGAVWLILFTSFFTNWNGLADSFRTYLPWLNRAGGDSPHIHPWHFYFDRLLGLGSAAKGLHFSERWILTLAAIGAATAFFSNRTLKASPTLARFLVFYTLLLAGIYSVIAYKTPWCLLNFWIGVLLLAGIGGAALVQYWRRKFVRVIMVLALAGGAWELADQSILASQRYAADRRNPYNYAQTPEPFLELIQRVETIGKIAPTGYDTVIKIFAPDSYGPLPWYLRRFKHTGWWEQLPEDPVAPVIIVSAKLAGKLDDRVSATHTMTGLYELHPGSFVQLYIAKELWAAAIPHLPKD